MMNYTNWVIDWIMRMGRKHGGTVHGKDGKSYDWGQALARECYGPEWIKLVPDDPTSSDVDRAKAWEEGKWPEWVEQ
ncbi:MAG: hypothetical protein ABSG90_11760 [Dehalococcoidia bacterium]|jgi:hypothetical protein